MATTAITVISIFLITSPLFLSKIEKPNTPLFQPSAARPSYHTFLPSSMEGLALSRYKSNFTRVFPAFSMPSFLNHYKPTDWCCFSKRLQFRPTQKLEGLYTKVPNYFSNNPKGRVPRVMPVGLLEFSGCFVYQLDDVFQLERFGDKLRVHVFDSLKLTFIWSPCPPVPARLLE